MVNKRSSKPRASAPRWRRSRIAAGVREALRPAARPQPYIAALAAAGLLAVSMSAVAGSPAEFNLADLDGKNGFVIRGINPSDASGRTVAGAGDLNRDGFSDVIIGAYQASPNGVESAGRSFVVFGHAAGFPAAIDLADLDGNNGFAINGIASGDFSGWSVSAAGDVNSDGFDDVIIGASRANPDGILYAGESYIVFGRDGGFPAEIWLADLDGSNGFTITGIEPKGGSGLSVSGAQDFNGDKIADVVIGAPFATSGAGKTYVMFGRSSDFPAVFSLSEIDGTNGIVINGVSMGTLSGSSVSNAGDINGDGIADVAIGDNNDINPFASGFSYVVFGQSAFSSAEINLADLDGSDGFAFIGAGSSFVSHQQNVAAAGDVNGDDVDDLVIGALFSDYYGPSSGKGYVLFGSKLGFPPAITEWGLDGSNGFIINGMPGDTTPFSASGAGDINDDGFADVIVGQADRYLPGSNKAGKSYVIFGREDGFPPAVNLSELDGAGGFAIVGIDEGDKSGTSVSYAGDVDGDGIGDVIIGAPNADPNGIGDSGESYVVFGRSSEVPPLIRVLGDIDGDGNQDIVALVREDGTLTATVKDAEDRSPINTVEFDANLMPVDLEVMADINANGAPELVVLGTGSTRSEVRDSLTGEHLGEVDFDSALSPIDLELVPDQTANAIPELAMLGRGSVRVEVKDPLTQSTVNTLTFNDNYVPKDLSVWSRDEAISVGVLGASKDPSQSDKVEIRDLDTGQIVKHLWVGRGWDPLQMEVVADVNGNGAPEAAILREQPEDQRVSIRLLDTASGRHIGYLGFDAQYDPVRLRVVPDLNGNGAEEVAVLASYRDCPPGNCDQKVWIKDTKTRQSIRQVFFGKAFIGQDLDVCPDINGNGKPELVMLGRRDDGMLLAMIKDSTTGELVNWVVF